MKITNHNCETNEIEIVDATKDQIQEIEKVVANSEAIYLAENQKKAARASALAKLAALGLTEDEIAAL